MNPIKRATVAAGFLLAAMAAHAQQQVVIVTSFPKELTEAYKKAFEAKNPGLKVEILNKGTSAGVASDGGTNFGGYAALSSFPPIRSWAYLTDYCLHYRKYVTNTAPQLSGVTTMLPPQPVGATNAGDLYSYYERIHRHPLIARIQYVFASSASGTSAAFIAQPVVTLT